MELAFRYRMVTARRPWVDTAFLTARNWFVPRMRAGEIATGTGLGEGSFEVMPTAALCVRDLRPDRAHADDEEVSVQLRIVLEPAIIAASSSL